MNTNRSGNLHAVMHQAAWQAAWDLAHLSKGTSMTDKEAMKLALDALDWEDCNDDDGLEQAKRIAITALKERLEDPMREVQRLGQEIEQEPVVGTKTWFEDGKVITQYLHPSDIYIDPPQRTEPICPDCKAEVLYECVACSSNNYPPQRTWVGLTDEEFHEACWESHVDPVTGDRSTGDREYAVRWTINKLKEKNT